MNQMSEMFSFHNGPSQRALICNGYEYKCLISETSLYNSLQIRFWLKACVFKAIRGGWEHAWYNCTQRKNTILPHKYTITFKHEEYMFRSTVVSDGK